MKTNTTRQKTKRTKNTRKSLRKRRRLRRRSHRLRRRSRRLRRLKSQTGGHGNDLEQNVYVTIHSPKQGRMAIPDYPTLKSANDDVSQSMPTETVKSHNFYPYSAPLIK